MTTQEYANRCRAVGHRVCVRVVQEKGSILFIGETVPMKVFLPGVDNAPVKDDDGLVPCGDAPLMLGGTREGLGCGLVCTEKSPAQRGIVLAQGGDAPSGRDDAPSEGGDGSATFEVWYHSFSLRVEDVLPLCCLAFTHSIHCTNSLYEIVTDHKQPNIFLCSQRMRNSSVLPVTTQRRNDGTPRKRAGSASENIIL